MSLEQFRNRIKAMTNESQYKSVCNMIAQKNNKLSTIESEKNKVVADIDELLSMREVIRANEWNSNQVGE